MQFNARLKIRAFQSVALPPHIAGCDAPDGAVLVEQHLDRGKSGKDLDAQRFSLTRQPTTHIAERNDIIPVVPKAFGQQYVRNATTTPLTQPEEAVIRNLDRNRCPEHLPVRQKFVERPRINHGTRENVATDLGCLFEQAHADLCTVGHCQLFKANRCRQSRGPATDDDHVELDGFSLHDSSGKFCSRRQFYPSTRTSSGTASNRSATNP